jgi:hypothetical protein
VKRLATLLVFVVVLNRSTSILEATLTADGTVDKIEVISGNPLLIQAAIDFRRDRSLV